MVSTWMGDHSKDLEAVAITTVKSKKRRKLPPLHDSGAKERKKKKKTPLFKNYFYWIPVPVFTLIVSLKSVEGHTNLPPLSANCEVIVVSVYTSQQLCCDTMLG